ncbi:MAG: hypothetical protein ACKVU0_07045 [Saprospiraceae bacterium]
MKKKDSSDNNVIENEHVVVGSPYPSKALMIILWIAFALFLGVFFLYHLSLPSSEIDISEDGVVKISTFLLSIVGMVTAIGITNLVKGFDVLIKYWPEEEHKVSKSRSGMRLLWGINILFLTIQLAWGMRLALDETASFLFFLYYGFLVSLVYAMIVYVFPENLESVFEKEKQECSNLYWSPSIIKRLCKLYLLLGLYMAATIPMSYIFWYNCYLTQHCGSKPKCWEFFTSPDCNFIGIIVKIICIAFIWKGLLVKKKSWPALYGYHDKESKNKKIGEELISKITLSGYGILKIYKQEKEQEEKQASSNPTIISFWDYAIIGISILTSSLYVVLRWNKCCIWW